MRSHNCKEVETFQNEEPNLPTYKMKEEVTKAYQIKGTTTINVILERRENGEDADYGKELNPRGRNMGNRPRVEAQGLDGHDQDVRLRSTSLETNDRRPELSHKQQLVDIS